MIKDKTMHYAVFVIIYPDIIAFAFWRTYRPKSVDSVPKLVAFSLRVIARVLKGAQR